MGTQAGETTGPTSLPLLFCLPRLMQKPPAARLPCHPLPCEPRSAASCPSRRAGLQGGRDAGHGQATSPHLCKSPMQRSPCSGVLRDLSAPGAPKPLNPQQRRSVLGAEGARTLLSYRCPSGRCKGAAWCFRQRRTAPRSSLQKAFVKPLIKGS